MAGKHRGEPAEGTYVGTMPILDGLIASVEAEADRCFRPTELESALRHLIAAKQDIRAHRLEHGERVPE